MAAALDAAAILAEHAQLTGPALDAIVLYKGPGAYGSERVQVREDATQPCCAVDRRRMALQATDSCDLITQEARRHLATRLEGG